ncbi:protein JINGUBANG-like [Miscanthus floridulus]|uniref:protein JINGUBANG-like n=1 Tax=Miscanthus floridulus TaxID=154761 RepID=UPI00345AD8C9
MDSEHGKAGQILLRLLQYCSELVSDRCWISMSSSTISAYCLATLKGNSSYVSGIVFHSDSIYVASSDGHIRLWPLDMAMAMNVQRAEQSTTTVAATNSPIKSIIATSNGGLVSSHQDGKIRVWHSGRRNGSSGDYLALPLRAVLPTAADCLRTFLFPSNYVEVRRHWRRRTWVHHVDAVATLALSPGGAEMYSVSWDRILKAWRLPSLRCVESVAPVHGDAINAVDVSADAHVYTGSADRAWRRHQPGRGEGKLALVATMERHKAAVNALALGADRRVLYSGACDKTVIVWERAGAGESVAATATATLRGHTGAVLCLAAAEQVVCSGSADRTVRVWRRGATAAAQGASYTCLAVLKGHAGAVKSLALVNKSGGDHGGSCDERCCSGCGCAAFVCSGSLDCGVKIWSAWLFLAYDLL